MSKFIDPSYYKKLVELDPEDVCRRASCHYEKATKRYVINVWGHEYAIYPEAGTIKPIKYRAYIPHEYFYLFIVYYMIYVKDIAISEEWISEKDMPGGTTFFRGPHVIPTYLITQAYNNNLQLFKKSCEQLGGTMRNQADAAFLFHITSRIPIAVLYWEGDEEFPSESKILFDKSITHHLTLDIIFSIAVEICIRIAKNIQL
jgi:hypothetical protein